MVRRFEAIGIREYVSRMSVPLRGRVRGSSIELDAPLPQLEGQRVLVLVEQDEAALSEQEQRAAWAEWARSGEQGPIDDEGEPEFP
jgi:hypothetical protein